MTDIVHPISPIKSRPCPSLAPLARQGHGLVDTLDSVMRMLDTANATDMLKDGIAPIDTLAPGQTLNEYLIDEVLGAGGFGVTYKAWDTLLETWVAIKEYFPSSWSFRDHDGVTVHPNTQGDFRGIDEQLPNYLWGLERFLEEARVLARVQHPYVVRVKRYFRAHGTAYIVMDYEEGQPLSEVLGESETLEEREVRGVLEDVLPALQAVHEQGFLHRDIKPSNLYVRASDRRVILIDFGAAREAVGRQGSNMTSLVTPGYSPPEQYTTRGDRYGPWTDLYALGAVLYRCVTGRSPTEAAERLLEDRLEPAVRAGAGRYSVNLLEVIDRALAVQPEHRFPSVQALQEGLRAPPNSAASVEATVLKFSKVRDAARPRAVELARVRSVEIPSASRVQKGSGKEWPKRFQAFWPDDYTAKLRQKFASLSADIRALDRKQPSPVIVGGGLVVLATLTALLMRAAWSPLAASSYERAAHVRYTATHENASAAPSIQAAAWVSEPPPSALKAEPAPAPHELSGPLDREHSSVAMNLKPIQPSEVPASGALSEAVASSKALPPFDAGAFQASRTAPTAAFLEPAPMPTAEQPAPWPLDQDRAPRQGASPVQPLLLPSLPPPTVRAPKAVTKAGVATVPSFASTVSMANAKARLGPSSKQAVTGSAADEIRGQRRGEPAERSRRSVRQVARSYGESRPRTESSRHGFRSWPKWGAVRNPWEAPAKTGFNQK
ncbi:MAG: protein kinase [Candidatus Competibacter sp.]